MAKPTKPKKTPDAYTDANYQILPNKEAIEAFNSKMIGISYSYLDVMAHEHAVAFTVAKMMDADLLAETKSAIESAMANGTDFNEFKKRLKPYLMSKGWWGEQVMTDPTPPSNLPPNDKARGEAIGKKVQLGSTRRLRTIYHTNLRTSHAAGRWERIQQTKDTFTHLQYKPSRSENKRLSHQQYYNIIRPVDDPIWQTIFPPNGYGCKCSVRQLTSKEAEQAGITKDDEAKIEFVDYQNPRTGQTIKVPVGITPSFAHNHGDRLGALLKIAEDKHGSAFAGQLQSQVNTLRVRLNGTLPMPSEWQTVAIMGKDICSKHQDVFDNIDLDEPHAFAKALLEIMKHEGVETGALVNTVGDAVENVQTVIKRYPASWVERANEVGTVYIRNLTSRGFQLHITDDKVVEALKYHVKHSKHFKPFAKFADDFKAGDGLLKLNNMTGDELSNKAYDIALHEFGHRLQAVMPELDEYFKQLWIDRTKGERTRPLATIQKERGERPYYDIKEVGRKDDFVNVYFGRNYGTDSEPKPMELLTMTMQTILGSGQDQSVTIKTLLKDDPEMVYLAIALLLRYKP